MNKKSLFLIGNALQMISMSAAAAAVGTAMHDAIRSSALSGAEIVEGIQVATNLLEAEQKKHGHDTELYNVISGIRQTLVAKAENIGLSVTGIDDATFLGDVGDVAGLDDRKPTHRPVAGKRGNGAAYAD